MCTALVVGNMIGSGIFLLPASLAPYGGLSLAGWVITSGGSILLALLFARLSRIVPRAGGPYAYTRRGLGDFAGFLVAWGYWISILATNAAIAVALVSYLSVFWPQLAVQPLSAALPALAFIWGLTAVNAAGVRQGGLVQLVTTVLKVLPLIGLALAGPFFFDAGHLSVPAEVRVSLPENLTSVVALTLWAFLGLESATVPAEHVSDPRRTIARATLLGTSLAALLYILSTTAVMGIVPPERLAVSTAPFADAARLIGGEWAAAAVTLGAVVSCFGALNGWILLQGQVPMACARDGLFPKVFARVSSNGTPVAGMLVSSLLVTVLMVLNYTRTLVELFTFVILLATMTCLLPYLFSAVSALMLGLRGSETAEAGRLWKGTTLAVVVFAYSFFAIAGTGRDSVYWGFLLLMAGLPVYVWVRRQDPRDDGS